MNSWIGWAALALITWGLYGFFPKLATRYISPQDAMPYYLVAGFVVGILILLAMGHKPEYHLKGAIYAGLAGICGVLGGFFYLQAVNHGRLSVVVVLTAMYPLITLLLSLVFLQEPITLKQSIGIGLALLAIILLVS